MSAESEHQHVTKSHRSRPGQDDADASAPPLVPGPVTETRRKVIAATIDLIDRHNYRFVTIDAVVRASGVSKSTIYRHWPSREVLVLEAFAHQTNLRTRVSDSGDAFADLRTYLSKLAVRLDFDGAASTVAGLIGDALTDEEFARMFRATMVRDRRHTFAAIIRLGQQRGQIRSDVDVEIVVDALYGAIHHRLLVTRQPFDQRFVDGLARFAAENLCMPGAR